MPLPSAVTGDDFCGVVEKVRRLGEACSALPVIASEAKQSRSQEASLDCFVASLLAMTL
jgi:hypothetical protein